MKSLTARQFQVSKLSETRMAKLHEIEWRLQRPLTPHEIRQKADPPIEEHGDIPHEQSFQLDNVINKIYVNCRNEAWKHVSESDVIPWEFELKIIHAVDKKVNELGMDFSVGKTDSSFLGKLRKAREW